MRKLLFVAGTLLLAVPFARAGTLFVPMDQQINLGYTYNSQSPTGDAIYPAFDNQGITFENDGTGFTRKNLTIGNGWYYLYVDLNLAGFTTPGAGVDLSVAGSTVEFDTRFFQDPDTNLDPYSDAPVFVRMYTYAADGNTYVGHRDFGIVYATQSPWSNDPYPTWTHILIDVNADTFTDGGTFDITNVSRVRFYGTDWQGRGDDFVDFKNLKITAVPEPASLLALALGLGALARARKRK